MARAPKLTHFVVDGSNIATEGRSQPSLKQLNEAVLAFMDEHPEAIMTVVVDATFGHRIDKKEVAEFDAGISNNELVSPPAGAVGRGDAFVLTIANKADAGVLSNDSFQEFHGDYDWLFDEGRLIGGKPVPHVGWVFVARTPVRGPKSRLAVREAQVDSDGPVPSKPKRSRTTRTRNSSAGTPSVSASEPMPIPDSPPPKSSGPSAAKESVNELMPFLEFAEKHPVGTSCTGTVETYASHGAYVRVGDVVVYLPLRLMANPAPRSARTAVTLGDSVTVVIVGYVPERRSIDGALPSMAKSVIDISKSVTGDDPSSGTAPRKTPARKTPARKTPARKTPARKTPVPTAAVKKAAVKKAPVKKVAVKKVAVTKAAASTASAKKSAATRGSQTKAVATSVPAKSAVKRAAGKRAADKKQPAEAVVAKKRAPKRAATNQAAALPSSPSVTPKRAAGRKQAAKRAAPKRVAAKKVSAP